MRQRQAVQPSADLGDGRGVVVGELEVRPDRPRALDEELDRLVLRRAARREAASRSALGKRERRHREDVLAAQVQRFAAGHQQR